MSIKRFNELFSFGRNLAGVVSVAGIAAFLAMVGDLPQYAVFMATIFMLGVALWTSNQLAVFRARSQAKLITESPWIEFELIGSKPPVFRPTDVFGLLTIDTSVHPLMDKRDQWLPDVVVLFPEQIKYKMEVSAIGPQGSGLPYYQISATNSRYARFNFHIAPETNHKLRVTFRLIP